MHVGLTAKERGNTIMSTLTLGDVETTALIPLMNRATETQRKNARIHDEKAVEIVQALGIDTKEYDKPVTHECVVARTIMFDETVRELIGRNPDAAVVNMGCGLDNRFERVDNGRIRWFDVDLPDSIEVRKKVYHDTDRRRMIGASVFEPDWISEIGTDSFVIAVAEGLFMYFDKEQHTRLLHNLTDNFKHGFLVVELMKPSMMDEKKHDTVKHTNAKFGWGTDSGKELEELCPRIKLVSEHSFAEQLRKSTFISKIIGIVSAKFNNRLAVFRW